MTEHESIASGTTSMGEYPLQYWPGPFGLGTMSATLALIIANVRKRPDRKRCDIAITYREPSGSFLFGDLHTSRADAEREANYHNTWRSTSNAYVRILKGIDDE